MPKRRMQLGDHANLWNYPGPTPGPTSAPPWSRSQGQGEGQGRSALG